MLHTKHCKGCEDDDFPAFTREQAQDLLPQIPEWKMNDAGTEISREFAFPDFASALAFVNKIGAVAEEEWHHPDIQLSWGKVIITLTTHSVHGLTENDFIVGAKVDAIFYNIV